MNPPQKKICGKCGQEKELEQFHRDRRLKDGRKGICAACCQAVLRHDYPPNENPAMIHRCPDCGNGYPLTLEHFHADRTSPSGFQTYCKKCQYAQGAKYKAGPKCKQVMRRSHLKRKYGISLGEYQAMADKQNQLCAICGEKKDLHIDHDHVSGLIRGLLCGDCNRALGLFRDSTPVLRNAILYLNHGEGACD